MNYFERRRLQKNVRHLLHESRHARHVKEDIAEEGKLAALTRAEQALKEAAESMPLDQRLVDQAAEQLTTAIGNVNPPRSHPAVRENIEILVVAVAVAMGFRAYFLQPFKIPTGSMQPTLNGINVVTDYTPGLMDKVPFRYAKYLLTGDRYVEVKARQSGKVMLGQDRSRNLFLVVGNKKHKYFKDMELKVENGQRVAKGELLARGLVRAGDHIFVDKVRYNFAKPRRGDIIVFTTENIRHPQIQHADHYIKRLVGLPGERISVRPPYLMVDGKRITEPYPFERMVKDPEYHGYSVPRDPTAVLNSLGSEIQLKEDQFLPFGDNTNHSLDGRFFGGVQVENLIGPAFAVYWPFGGHWGRIR